MNKLLRYIFSLVVSVASVFLLINLFDLLISYLSIDIIWADPIVVGISCLLGIEIFARLEPYNTKRKFLFPLNDYRDTIVVISYLVIFILIGAWPRRHNLHSFWLDILFFGFSMAICWVITKFFGTDELKAMFKSSSRQSNGS